MHHKAANFERSVEAYSQIWQKFKNKNSELFEGIILEKVPDLEVCFEININILNLDEYATTLYASTGTFQDTIFLKIHWWRYVYIQIYA